MPLLYVLRDEYLAPRRLLAALGVEGGDVIDETIEADTPVSTGPEPPAADRDARHAQIQAFMAAH